MALHPDREGRQPAQDEERRERRERGAGIDLDPPNGGNPGTRPGDDPRQHVAVAAHVFRGRFDDEIRTELDRPAEVRRGERVVDDDRGAMAMAQARERVHVHHGDRRVRDRLEVEDARRRGRERGFDGLVIGRVHEVDAHAHLPEHRGHERARRAVHELRAEDPVARRNDREQRSMDRGHARREDVRGLRALEECDSFGQRGVGRVIEPCVRVARLSVGDDVRQLAGVRRGERHGLVDRHRIGPLRHCRRGCRGADRSRREALQRPAVGVAHGPNANELSRSRRPVVRRSPADSPRRGSCPVAWRRTSPGRR